MTRSVRANKGSAGIDGITFEAIVGGKRGHRLSGGAGRSADKQDVQTGPVKRVMIPKSDVSFRPLGIPAIRDRVVQMAVKLVIEPIFEADFCESSYGFRPRTSAHDAVEDISYTLNRGYTKVIYADISKYFDTIPHANLMAVVAEQISDGEILRLINRSLTANCLFQGKKDAITACYFLLSCKTPFFIS